MTPTHCPHCGLKWADSSYCLVPETTQHTQSIVRSRACYERQIAALKAEVERVYKEGSINGMFGNGNYNRSRAKRIATGELVAGKDSNNER